MNDQMPPVAQFSLPNFKQRGQPQVQNSQPLPSGMPPVATFSLPKNLKNSQQTAPQGLGSRIAKGVGDVYNAIASPLIGVAALPFQAGLAGYNKLTGSNIEDPFKQGVGSPAQLLGSDRTSVTPLNLEKKLGDVAQVGSLLIPGEGVASAIGSGVLQGAGSAMSEGKGLAETATQGLIGGATGGTIASGAKLAGGLIESAGKAISGKASEEAVQGIKNAYSSALNLHASERAFENRSGKDLADVLVKNKAPLARHANGTLDASAAISKLQSTLDPLNAQAEQLLTRPQGVVRDISLTDTLQAIKSRIQKLTISQAEKNAAVNHATEIMKAEIGQYGNTVAPDVADKIKQGFWGSSFKGNLTTADKLQGNVSYLAGNSLKDSIEKAVEGTDTNISLKALNQERSDLVDAIKRLTAMDGVRLLKGGRLGNMAGGVIGAITGAASGHPLAALAGDYFGTKAAEFLQNPSTKIAVASAKAKAAGLLPNVFGKAAKPVGGLISKVGSSVKRTARPAGLLGNILTR